MKPGDVVMFKTSDREEQWTVGLLLRLDNFLGVAEVLVGEDVHYAPKRLLKPYRWSQV